MRYLLDTNICIYAIKERPANVAEKLRSVPQGDAVISSVTAFELWHGIHKSMHVKKNTAALHQFLSVLPVLAFDADDAEACGQLRATLEKRGTPIGPYDLQIAAQAKVRKLTLVTHNGREFARVPGLDVEDWAALSS